MNWWNDGLDVFFVFAGLFSAEVMTFVVQISQSLQLDYTQVAVLLGYELANVQRAAANGALQYPTYGSTDSGLQVSLSQCSHRTGRGANERIDDLYMAVPSGTPRDRCRVRPFQYIGLQKWRAPFIIGFLLDPDPDECVSWGYSSLAW
ncbi:hypothetical protein EV421DRAFT_1910211 [Armillaria borealis]|uniref:DUF6535 domain-containing protein n=1 Tax=Armillaria borealis TaxID=47425 RepID=A0AA39J2S0_9AGAR|nr:hypothetical protein EV421DRAFT_1910211 [Armillaria borealis]